MANQNETSVTKDAGNKKIVVVREFNASPEEVWKAWTESKILDEWWAPKPWKAKTKKLDFREGGTWLYAMEGPNGEVHWSRVDFEDIEEGKCFSAAVSFVDENGNPINNMQGSHWKSEFTKTENGTTVTVEITFDNEEAFNQLIQMGFEGGITMAQRNLDELLAKK